MIDIPGYRDFELIGTGGFAQVYKAHQLSVGREVAIKVLSDPAPDADLVRRFERESKAVGALSWHPNIAAVVDAGTTKVGQAWIGFELLTGGTLEDKIANGPMPWREAVASMIQIADAVEAAHREDVLHRDIKPANILLNRLGDAKLADFGIASMQDGNKTETGQLATTVAHAAPELFDGAPSSRATDVYALGSTLHNLVTGTAPFQPQAGSPIATVIRRIATDAPPTPDPELVPAPVAGVIAHALAKQPDYRPRSAHAFGQALQQIQRAAGLGVTAMPVSDAAPAQPTASPQSDDALREQQSPTTFTPAPEQPGPSQAPAGRGTTRLVVALAGIAVLLAAGLGGALLFDARTGNSSILGVTAGGARVVDINVLLDTQMIDFPPTNAIDGDPTTDWGIARTMATGNNIVGTSYVLAFDDQVTVSSVGITNGQNSSFARVRELVWGTSFSALNDGNETLRQQIPNEAGNFVESVSATTNQLVLVIADVHDADAEAAGIAEILIEVRDP